MNQNEKHSQRNLWNRLIVHMKEEDYPIKWAISRFLWYTGLCNFFKMDIGLFKMRFYRSSLSLSLWTNKTYNHADTIFLSRVLNPGDTVVDVGANIGLITLTSASFVGRDGLVVAFEPHPRIFSYLRGNVALNHFKNIQLINCALGSQKSSVYFSDELTDDQNRVSSEKGLKVDMETLDEQLSSVPGRIKLLKVDVEGYEKYVFEGASKTLTRTDYIFFEIYDSHFVPLGYSTGQLLQMLSKFGFGFYRITETGKEIAVNLDFVPEKCMNLLGRRNTI